MQICQDVTVTQRVYAHAQFDRVLVTELAVDRTGGEGDVEVARTDLSGSESAEDFDWDEASEVETGV